MIRNGKFDPQILKTWIGNGYLQFTFRGSGQKLCPILESKAKNYAQFWSSESKTETLLGGIPDIREYPRAQDDGICSN